MFSKIEDFFLDNAWIPITALVMFSLMVYAAVGNMTLNYLRSPELRAVRELCLERSLTELPNGSLDARQCPVHRVDKANANVAATFWPITVPVVFAIRHPIGILLLTGSGLLVAFGAIGGHRTIKARRERDRLSLEAAEALLAREAPELLAN